MRLSGLNSITVGCLLCIGVMLSGRFVQARSEAEIQKAKLAEIQRVADEKELADNAARNRIAQFNQLIITDYQMSSKPPTLDWKKNVDPTKKTYIYDKNRVCVGNADKGIFHFISTDQNACNR